METCSAALLQKLGVKDGKDAVFLHVPPDVQSQCAAIPTGANVSQQLGKAHDIIFTFYESSKELKKELPQLKQAIKPSGMIWVCWRKGNMTDVSRDLIWQLGEECGLSSVSSIAVADGWAAMKLMYPKLRRRG